MYFFLTGNFLSNYVDGVLVPQRLPPKAAVICQRQRVITFEGKRNGGLDLLKTAVSVSDTGKRTKSSARQRFFSFPRCGGRCLNMQVCFMPQRPQNIPC